MPIQMRNYFLFRFYFDKFLMCVKIVKKNLRQIFFLYRHNDYDCVEDIFKYSDILIDTSFLIHIQIVMKNCGKIFKL